MRYELVCTECGKVADEGSIKCRCGAPLETRYVLENGMEWRNEEKMSIERYRALLPVDSFPALHVGWTPVTRRSNIIFKMEYLSAGGSFKDRGACIATQKAKELGAREITVDSSGNSAIAFSLFAKMIGLKAQVFVPASAPQGKKSLLRFLGADVHEIDSSREEVNRRAMEEGKAYVGHWWNPYFIDGVKTMAFEIFEQAKDVDCVIAPVGSGTLFLGLYKGFKELVALGALERIPKLIAAQSSGYASLCSCSCYKEESKLADGIAIKDPPRRRELLRALKDSNGECVVVNDREIAEALIELRDLGFIVEPTSAAPYAAFKKIEPEGKVLIPLTGSGFKVMDELISIERGEF
jgi:threonine synthase